MNKTSSFRIALIAIVGLCAFVLSFHALAGMASSSNIPSYLTWALPVAIDGASITAALSVAPLSKSKSRFVRAYPWIVLGVLGAVSAAANAYHATGLMVPAGVAAGLGCLPAVSILLTTHLGIEAYRIGDGTPRTVKRSAAAPARPRSVAVPSAGTTPRAVGGSKRAGVEAVLAYVAEHNVWPTGTAAGEMLGVSRKSGARYVAAAREAQLGSVHE